MWKEIFESTGGLSGKALEHVLEIAIRIMPVQLGGLDETHDASSRPGQLEAGDQSSGVEDAVGVELGFQAAVQGG